MGWDYYSLHCLFGVFWLRNDSDQLCSSIFTISNTPLFVCVYLDNFSDDWQKCKNSSRTWPIAFGLSSIPFIIRLGQSVKRYFDSKHVAHLVNVSFLLFSTQLWYCLTLAYNLKAAKYGTGIVSYLFYFMWSYRRKNRRLIFPLRLNWIVFTVEESRGAIFALWCFFNTCYSIYACSWVSFFFWAIYALGGGLLKILCRTF